MAARVSPGARGFALLVALGVTPWFGLSILEPDRGFAVWILIADASLIGVTTLAREWRAPLLARRAALSLAWLFLADALLRFALLPLGLLSGSATGAPDPDAPDLALAYASATNSLRWILGLTLGHLLLCVLLLGVLGASLWRFRFSQAR